MTAVLLVPFRILCELFPNRELQGSLCSSDDEVIGISIIQVSHSQIATGTSAIICGNLKLEGFKKSVIYREVPFSWTLLHKCNYSCPKQFRTGILKKTLPFLKTLPHFNRNSTADRKEAECYILSIKQAKADYLEPCMKNSLSQGGYLSEKHLNYFRDSQGVYATTGLGCCAQ